MNYDIWCRIFVADKLNKMNEQEKNPVPGGTYNHYKGGTYLVIGLGEHSETKEQMVLYRNIEHNTLHARPLDEWIKPVPDGRIRFNYQGSVASEPNDQFKLFRLANGVQVAAERLYDVDSNDKPIIRFAFHLEDFGARFQPSLGFDTDEKRDEVWNKVDQAFAERIVEQIMKDLNLLEESEGTGEEEDR